MFPVEQSAEIQPLVLNIESPEDPKTIPPPNHDALSIFSGFSSNQLDSRGYNKLMIACEAGQLDEVKNLIPKCKKLDYEVNGESAASVAFSKGHFEVLLELLKANSKFPYNYQQEMVSDELKDFVDLSLKIHEKVRVGNLQEILNENSNLKYFYDIENNSLLKKSLETKKFSIFKILWENNLKLAPHENIWDILEKFSSEEFNKFRKIQLINFENFSEILSDQESQNIKDYRDLRGFNALMIAAEFGYNELADFCIQKELFMVDTRINGHSASNLAFKGKNFEILLKLLRANAEYPEDFSTDEIIHEELEKFIKMSLDIHYYIDLNEVENIKEILKENPLLDYFYDLTNRSAFRHAVEDKKFEIYKLLVENFVNFGPNENYDSIRSHLSEEEKLKMTSIQFELSESLISPTILTLMAHSFVGHESKNKRRSLAMEAFHFLLNIPRVEKILKIVATQKNYQIVFDFNRDTIQILDATAEIYMNGTFYTNGRIYIAAAKLYDDEGRFDVLSALIHELCHFAMFVMYQNTAKPYKSDDEKSKNDFDKIIEECRGLMDDENIIKAVYLMYNEEMIAAELIVRPVHLDVFYYGLEELSKKQETFKSIYDFYDTKCIPEMERILPQLEAKADKDKKISKLRKFNIFFILIILALIFTGLIAFLLYNPTITWNDLSPTDKIKKLKNLPVKFYNFDVILGELYADDSKLFDLLSPEQIKKSLNGDTSELSKAINEDFNSLIFLNWSNMSQNLQNIFLTQKVDFQGQIFTLNERRTQSFFPIQKNKSQWQDRKAVTYFLCIDEESIYTLKTNMCDYFTRSFSCMG